MIDKRKFAKTVFDENIEAFVVWIIFLNLSSILIYSAKKTQIVLPLAEKVKNLAKYSDFLNIFLKKKLLVLLEIIKLNQHAMKF